MAESMVPPRKSSTPMRVTAVFYFAFAVWSVAASRKSSDFYRHAIGEFPDLVLTMLILGLFLVLMMAAMIEGIRRRRLPWGHIVAAAAPLLAAEIIWRLGLDRLANLAKDAAIVADVTKPLLLALGVAAIFAQRAAAASPPRLKTG